MGWVRLGGWLGGVGTTSPCVPSWTQKCHKNIFTIGTLHSSYLTVPLDPFQSVLEAPLPIISHNLQIHTSPLHSCYPGAPIHLWMNNVRFACFCTLQGVLNKTDCTPEWFSIRKGRSVPSRLEYKLDDLELEDVELDDLELEDVELNDLNLE